MLFDISLVIEDQMELIANIQDDLLSGDGINLYQRYNIKSQAIADLLKLLEYQTRYEESEEE